MEHKLILGGEQYLPFARSRLKALRAATGLYAAREQFVTADGIDVTVRYVGDQEYIRIVGGQLSIAMDAGLIDLQGVAEANPLRFTSGTRQDTASTQIYNAPFSLAATAGKWSAWRSNPDAAPFHQMAGTVLFPPFVGHLPDGTLAPSFKAKRKAVEPATTPPTWLDDPADTALVAKKAMALSCPASMFTGRMRLYVQALYGRPLHAYASDTSVNAALPSQLLPSLEGVLPPALLLPAFKRPEDTATYPQLRVDTSTGLYLHAESGRHFLLQITTGHVNAYPMKSSPAGEALRKYLAGAKVDKTDSLSQDDRDRLEAFILAYSLPDVKNVIALDCAGASAGFSLGYGWHWNRSGTAADLVSNSSFDQGVVSGISYAGMESTHRRVTVAFTVGPPTEEAPRGVDSWEVTHAVIEGPTRWAVNRGLWCLAEPEWQARGQVKTTPRNSLLFACDAPFYAFYVGDALQVCRARVVAVPEEAHKRIGSSPGDFAGTPYGIAPNEFTAGLLGGFCEDVATSNAHFEASFSIGTTTADGLVIGKSTTSAFWGVDPKSIYADSTHSPSGDTFTATGIGSYDTGYPFPYSSTGYQPVAIVAPIWTSVDAPAVFRFTRTTENRVSSESSTATIIVPLYDAEAVFMEATRFATIARSSRHVMDGLSSAFSRSLRLLGFPYNPPGAVLNQFLVGGTSMSVLNETFPPPATDVVTTPVLRVMRGVAGLVAATMDDLASYHDNSLDVPSSTYSAWSGTRTDTPAAFAPGHINAVGIVGAIPLFPALVGWV